MISDVVFGKVISKIAEVLINRKIRFRNDFEFLIADTGNLLKLSDVAIEDDKSIIPELLINCFCCSRANTL